MKKTIAVLIAFASLISLSYAGSIRDINAAGPAAPASPVTTTSVTTVTAPVSQEQSAAVTTALPDNVDPVRARLQYLLTRGREEVLRQEPMFAYFPEMIGFDLKDVTADGVLNLILRREDNDTIYIADINKNNLGEFPDTSVFYTNGNIAVMLKESKNLCKDFHPYAVYGYSSETNKFEFLSSVDAWEKEKSNKDADGNPFPDDVDSTKKGVVYYIDDAEHDKNTPVNSTEYNKWKKKYLGGASVIKLEYQDLTQENIDAIDTSVPVVTTTAVTTTAATTTTVTTTTGRKLNYFPEYNYDTDLNEVVNTADFIALTEGIIYPERMRPDRFYGDVNCDGLVNSRDVIAMRSFLRGD